MRTLSCVLGSVILLGAGLPAVTWAAQVVDTLTVGFSDPLGDLAWDGATLWTCERSSAIVRRDPTTGEILQGFRLRLPHVVDFGLEWDGIQLWVGALDGSADLYRLNPFDGAILGSLYLRNAPTGSSGDVHAIARKGDELWVLLPGGGQDSHIARVDPVTGTVSNALRRTEPALFGLAWDGSSFVTCSYSTRMIYRIDPHTGQVVSQFPAPSEEGSSPTGLGWDGRYLWVSSYPQLYKIDMDAQPIEQLAIARIQRGPRYAGRGKDLSWDNGLFWYTEVYDDGIYLLDMGFPSSVVRHLQMSYAPTGIERVGSSLWTTYNFFIGGNLVEVDVDSGRILRVLPFPRNRMPLGMDFDGTDLWVVSARMDAADSLYRVSQADGRVLASIPTPGHEAAGVAWDGNSLWQTDQSTDLVYELDPVSGAVRSQFGLPIGTAHGLAFDGQSRTFWLTDDSDRILQLVPPSGTTHLLQFHATTSDDGVVVHWQPTAASRQEHFVLERGDASGGPYAEIARVDGTGESYSVTDAGPIPGSIYYYRLQAIGTGTKVLGPLSVAYQYAYPPIRRSVGARDLRAVRFAEGIRIEWSMDNATLAEIASISIERATGADGPFIRITTGAHALEANMSFEDRSAPPASSAWYRIALMAHSGESTIVGPVAVSQQEPSAIRLDPPIVSGRYVEIRYAVGRDATHVHLAVYDGRGRCVRVLENAFRGPGERRVTWDARDTANRATARGVYFVQLKASGTAISRRLVWTHS